jgi:TonB family protein
LQSGEIQQCSDAETDPRVNAEVSRRLGLKSILVLPLTDGKEPFGILEVFSSRKNAFGDRDINTLQVLARRIIDSKRGAERVTASFLTSPADPVHESETAIPDPGQARPGRTDALTYVLGVLVITVAVGLGLLLGWRGAVVWGLRGGSPERRVVAVVQADHTTNSGHEQQPGSTPATDSTPTSKDGSISQPGTSAATPPVDRSSDALVVSQNGKVIYRSRPTGNSAAGESNRAEDSSEAGWIHRVEPEYPPEARTQRIQGVVVLDVQIAQDGAVQNIEVVEGNAVLAEAAVQAVRQWRYRAYIVGGRPGEMQTRITIRFKLPSN